MPRSIFLIGLPGVGKSVVSQRLAGLVALSRVGLDDVMTKKVGVLRDYIQAHGWPAFRELEAQTLAEIVAAGPAVVDCGGGVVETPANVELMRAHGEIVWLRATIETMQARLNNSHRRMALGSATDDAKIRELLARREPLYTAAATLLIDTDGKTPETVAEEIATEVRL